MPLSPSTATRTRWSRRLRAGCQPLLLFLFALLVSLNAGCGASPFTVESPLRVGYTSWPGHDVIEYGQLAKLFDKRDLRVELIRFEDQFDADRAFARNRVDVVLTPIWSWLHDHGLSDTPTAFLAVDISRGSDGVVARPPISSIPQLVGKRVALKLNSVNHQVFLEAMDKYKLKPESIAIDDVTNSTAARRLAEGKVDAAVLWEPVLSSAASRVGGNIIFSTREVDSLVIDVAITRRSFLQARRKELLRFCMTWFDIMKELDENPDEVFRHVAPAVGLMPLDFSRQFEGLRKGDRKMNLEFFGPESGLEKRIPQILAFIDRDLRHNRAAQRQFLVDGSVVLDAERQWKP